MTPVEEILSNVKLPFVGKLHDYQEEDVNRLAPLDISALFLDLGLGKTVMSALIGVYHLLHGSRSCYVLCPASLIAQWVGVLEKMGVAVVGYAGSPAARKKINLDVDFVVMSFEIFQKDYESLAAKDVFFIIDEATILCNSQNILFKMLMGGEVKKNLPPLPGKKKPEVRKRTFDKLLNKGCLLTGTPINRPIDAYGLIAIKTPEIYDNYNQFMRIHVVEVDKFDQPKEYDELEFLNSNLLFNASHRLVTDHIDLPPIIFKTVWYDLAPDHMAVYEKLLEEKFLEVDGNVTINAINAIAMYNWAQKLVLNPEHAEYKKDPVCIELLDLAVKSVNNFIIFNNYVMSNTKLMERYKAGGIFGGVPPTKKNKFIEDFKSGKLKGLVCHPKSGGIGLDLPMCQHVFFPELPVTPRDFRQSCGRVYRQGQKETVIITTFVARKTIQETLFRRIMDKDDLMGEVIRTSSTLRGDLLSGAINEGDLKRTKAQMIKDLKGGK